MVVHGLNFKLKVKVLNQSKKVIMGNFCFSESCIYRNMLGKDKDRSQVWHLQFDGRVPSGGSIQQEAVHMCLAPRESQQTHYELWLQGKHQEWEDSAKTAETKKTARPRRSESEGLTCIWDRGTYPKHKHAHIRKGSKATTAVSWRIREGGTHGDAH